VVVALLVLVPSASRHNGKTVHIAKVSALAAVTHAGTRENDACEENLAFGGMHDKKDLTASRRRSSTGLQGWGEGCTGVA
jgi:hypothetical protein